MTRKDLPGNSLDRLSFGLRLGQPTNFVDGASGPSGAVLKPSDKEMNLCR
jgi:hypothetical protein